MAVKVLDSVEPVRKEEFLKEAKLLERLRHPHVLSYRGHVYNPEGGEVRGFPWGRPEVSTY